MATSYYQQSQTKTEEPPLPPFTIGGAPSPAQQLEKAGLNAALNQPAPSVSQQPATATTPTKASTTNAQAAATAQNMAGNSTAGTTPPPASTGSGLPAYAASFNFWQNNSAPGGAPGGAVYTPPTSLGAMGVDFSKVPTYDPNGVQVPTWQQPAGSSAAATEALNSLLSGDASGMDTSAMKNKLKEQRLIMEKDQGRQSRQAAAGRGMLDSGWQAADERRIGAESKKDILGGFRDVDIAAANAATANKIAGSTALNTVLTGDVDRASAGYNNELAGATLKDQQQRFATTDARQQQNDILEANQVLGNLQQGGAQSILDKYKAESATTMEGRAQDIEVARAKSNELLGRLGLAVNLEEISRGTSRDKMQFLTDIFSTLVQNEQHNAQLGLGYAQMGQSMNETMEGLIKSLGL
jgi:hypothetical protein